MTSEIKVNQIKKASGSTITIGESGDTISLASGASQTGFGRSGSVDWQTTPKTSNFTAVSGEGYFINSSSGITMNLPAGSAGAIVAVSDYARNFATHVFTISPNGSEKIGGQASDAVLGTNGQAATFVYVDSTKGWVNVQNAESTETGQLPFVAATGGDVTITCGNFKTHIFTSPGTFTVTESGTPSGADKFDYVVVGGGAGGGGDGGGGGGAGGFRLANSYSIPAPTMSPLANSTALTASTGSFPITVGGGGTAGVYSPASCGGDGSDSTFSTITSAGGGNGAKGAPGSGPHNTGGAGGSGGGGTRGGVGGAGNTPPTTPIQGNAGGPGGPQPNGDGGGGAGAVGGDSSSGPTAGAGGIGSFVADTYFGPTAPSYGTPGPVSSTRYFAGGGGGGGDQGPSTGGAGGNGGGGAGGARPNSSPGTAGTTNTGGGGGGAGVPGCAGAGGSGIVMIRYKFQ